MIKSAVIAGETTVVAVADGWPRDTLSLGYAVKQAQKRPSAIARLGNFSGIFDEFVYSGGEEWI